MCDKETVASANDSLIRTEFCESQSLFEQGSSKKRSRRRFTSFDDGTDEENKPSAEDTKHTAASGSLQTGQVTTPRDSGSPGKLPPIRRPSKGEEPVRVESLPPPPPGDTDLQGGIWSSQRKLWVLGLFNDRNGLTVYGHLNAKTRRTDFTLFTGLREKYFSASSWSYRLMRLRQVSAVRVVRVGE